MGRSYPESLMKFLHMLIILKVKEKQKNSQTGKQAGHSKSLSRRKHISFKNVFQNTIGNLSFSLSLTLCGRRHWQCSTFKKLNTNTTRNPSHLEVCLFIAIAACDWLIVQYGGLQLCIHIVFSFAHSLSPIISYLCLAVKISLVRDHCVDTVYEGAPQE